MGMNHRRNRLFLQPPKWDVPHPRQLCAILIDFRQCVSTPFQIFQEACTPPQLFFATCSYHPLVCRFGVLSVIATTEWYSQQWSCYLLLTSDLSTYTSTFWLALSQVSVWYFNDVLRSKLCWARKLKCLGVAVVATFYVVLSYNKKHWRWATLT